MAAGDAGSYRVVVTNTQGGRDDGGGEAVAKIAGKEGPELALIGRDAVSLAPALAKIIPAHRACEAIAAAQVEAHLLAELMAGGIVGQLEQL